MNMLDPMMNAGQFMSHGGYYRWNTSLVARRAISDAFIMLAYHLIPVTLFHFVRRQKDLEFHGMFMWFAVFISTGGTKIKTIHQHR